MRPFIISVFVLSVLLAPFATAQQAGENINVLPVVLPDQRPDDWYLVGDGYLQRQVEPTIAASTLNPDHLLAFFVDYRAVDIRDDPPPPIPFPVVLLALNLNPPTQLLAGLLEDVLPRLEAPTAATEAWIGMSRSYDGGLTWSGGFLPGAPFDTGIGGNLITPIDGLQAATDPVLAPGPCGKFYLVFMAFTRGDESKLVVARYVDNNYAGGGEHITYDGMTVIEEGNNATHGYFLDKPDIEVDVVGDSTGDLCADRVYVSYSTFNGLDKTGKFQSKVSFARSFDGGLTFDTQKLNPPYNQNQGSALAVDPNDGTIYMIWRHFWDPDAILMVKSTDYGKKWSKPVNITGDLAMAAFDQPSISIVDAQSLGAYSPMPSNSTFPEVAFRSNGFPTAAITDQGTVFVAWQERVDASGVPSANGSPKIVVVKSGDGGDHWTGIDGGTDRVAVDMATRDSSNPPAPGFGALHQPRPAGQQVQPKLVFSGGQLLLAYFESRGRIFNYGSGTWNEALVPEGGQIPGSGGTLLPATSIISGYDRQIDFRAALLDPATGALLCAGDPTTCEPPPTIQVSRYPIRADADLSDGEQLTDVAPVNPPCLPDDADGVVPCIRQTNRANAPQSASGSTPFIGDYPDVAPVAQFVFDGQKWKWATEPTDVPYQGFHTIFTDNRHLIPATEDDDGLPSIEPEWELSQYYDPPFEDSACDADPGVPECVNKPGCINAGSRNTDVLTSKIDMSLVLSAPTTSKDLDHARGFPFTVKNTTGVTRTYNIAIEGWPAEASFVRTDVDVADVTDLIDDPVNDEGTVDIFAYSSTSLVVYVAQDYADPVQINVSEDCSSYPDDLPCTNARGALVFNSGFSQPSTLNGQDSQEPVIWGSPEFQAYYNDPDNPFVINPFVINPFVINPFVINPFVINPFVINPFVINPFVINPFVINTSLNDDEEPDPDALEAVIDTTWTVTPGTSNSASSYLPVVNIDNAQAFIDAGYSFQLIVSKGSLYGGLSGCESTNVGQPQILANVYPNNPDNLNQNPFVINPFVINPFVINPFVINPFVINSTFTMAPPENDDSGVVVDDTTKAPPPSNNVNITLRAFKFKNAPPTVNADLTHGPGDGDGEAALKEENDLEYMPWVDPPSLVIVPLPCDTTDLNDVCFVTQAPDLVPGGIEEPSEELKATVGGTLSGFPSTDWYVENQGYGEAAAENGPLEHGFYLCQSVPGPETELDPSGCVALTPKYVSTKNPLTNVRDANENR